MTNDEEQNEQSAPSTDEAPSADAAVEQAAVVEETTPEEDPLVLAIAERDAHYDRFLRAQAELENYRRRVQRERTEEARYGSSHIARDLLPVLDNLSRAIEAAEGDGDGNLVDGVKMVAGQFEAVLASHGIEPISTTDTFDPNLHEAVAQVPSPDHPEMAIVQEVERGWILHDRVLRPAKVVVSNGQ